VRVEADTNLIAAQIAEFVKDWALPFFERYRNIASIVKGHEARDERLHLDRRFYLYMAAACLHAGQVEKARAILDEWFGRPASRKQYAKAFDYVARSRSQ
jgi:hypothetical protein